LTCGRERVSWAHHLQSLSRSPPPTGPPPPSPTAQHRRTDIIVAVSRKRSADGTVIVQVSCRPVVYRRPVALRHPLGVSVVDSPFTSLVKCAFADGTHSTSHRTDDCSSRRDTDVQVVLKYLNRNTHDPSLKSGENGGELLPPDQPPAWYYYCYCCDYPRTSVHKPVFIRLITEFHDAHRSPHLGGRCNHNNS